MLREPDRLGVERVHVLVMGPSGVIDTFKRSMPFRGNAAWVPPGESSAALACSSPS